MSLHDEIKNSVLKDSIEEIPFKSDRANNIFRAYISYIKSAL